MMRLDVEAETFANYPERPDDAVVTSFIDRKFFLVGHDVVPRAPPPYYYI
jgi:hypothetical protein